jgi:peptidyl-prolyl cis-trans isomerase C
MPEFLWVKKERLSMRTLLMLMLFIGGIAGAAANDLADLEKSVVVKHKTGTEITKKELSDEVHYIQRVKQLPQLPTKSVLKDLSVQLLLTKMLSEEALEQKLEQDPEVVFELQRSRASILAKARLKQLSEVEMDEKVRKQLAREYYFSHEEAFTEKEQRKVSHILISATKGNKAEKLAQAEALFKALQSDPARFAEIAKEHSDDKGTAEKEGALGWATKDRFVKPFADAAFAIAKVGELVGPVETPFGYHIIRLDELKKSRLKPFSEIEKEAKVAAVKAFIDDRKKTYIDNLRASADRQLNEELLQELLNELISNAKHPEQTED